MAQAMVVRGADYVLALQRNPSRLWETGAWRFRQDEKQGSGAEETVTVGQGQGRIATRRGRTLGADPAALDLRHTLHAWPHRHRIVCLES